MSVAAEILVKRNGFADSQSLHHHKAKRVTERIHFVLVRADQSNRFALVIASNPDHIVLFTSIGREISGHFDVQAVNDEEIERALLRRPYWSLQDASRPLSLLQTVPSPERGYHHQR